MPFARELDEPPGLFRFMEILNAGRRTQRSAWSKTCKAIQETNTALRMEKDL